MHCYVCHNKNRIAYLHYQFLVLEYYQKKNDQYYPNYTLRYYDVNLGRDRFSIPFEVTSSFKHDFSTVTGNREACSQETLRKINEKAVAANLAKGL